MTRKLIGSSVATLALLALSSTFGPAQARHLGMGGDLRGNVA